MKKTLLFGTLLFAALGAKAQGTIADGSPAPEIHGPRIISVEYPAGQPAVITYGEEISIQAYLNAGKTVVMDGSATWCGPCWSFHNSKTLDKLYAAYGPEGSDELRVLFVEADPGTEISELGGVEAPVIPPYQERGAPQGDWLTGVSYPVINSDDLVKPVANGGYGLNAFPTIYVITPNGQDELGTVTRLEWDSLGNMVAAINEARGGAPMAGVDGYGKVEAIDTRYCDAEGNITGYVSSTFGHSIMSAQVQLKKDGEVLETKDFTTTIGGYGTEAVEFTGHPIEAGADYQMVLTKVNGADPLAEEASDLVSEEFNLFPSASVESGKNITATLHTDKYPEEIQFGIYDSEGNFVYISPVLSATAANRNKTFTYNFTLDPIDCYGIVMVDGYGDGWIDGTDGPYGLTLKSGSTTLFESNGDIGARFQQDATFKTNGVLGNGTPQLSSFAVYPNPSNGIFTFNTQEVIDITVIDMTGKAVYTTNGLENGGSINLSGLQKGVYIAKISGNSGERNEKLIIK